jgi:hypothetical protein
VHCERPSERRAPEANYEVSTADVDSHGGTITHVTSAVCDALYSPRMSAFGPKRTRVLAAAVSAFGGKADMDLLFVDVRF